MSDQEARGINNHNLGQRDDPYSQGNRPYNGYE
jgi:hypothetical protein